MKKPTLYKKTSTGADQFWEIGTEGNIIVTRWGQIRGAIQEARDVVKEGKNTGKKNATTATQQAEAEAEAQWTKKLKKGYVQSLKDAQAGKVDAIIEGGIPPMLAHRFDEQGHKIDWPAYAQPKLDGHRCIAIIEKGKCTLWSRSRKQIKSMPHIVRELESGFSKNESIVLDGELYNHAYRKKFEELTSLIRPDEPREGHKVVQYHSYDIADPLLSFEGRLELLKRSIGDDNHVKLVETKLVEDEDDLVLFFESCLAQGYEGAMVRNSAGEYVFKRSYDLLKIKEFMDQEFTIKGVEEGRGKLAGHAIFVCEWQGKDFRAKMRGDTAKLRPYWDNPKLALGRKLTVKFQGWTKYGVPRFPVAERFKEDI